MAHILAWCSSPSLDALNAIPKYEVAKKILDTFQVFQLVVRVHQFGSSRMKFQFLVDFLQCKLAGRSFDAYVVDLNVKFALVLGAFES